MGLVMPNTRELLKSLRDNDWYITSFPFLYRASEYAVVFEDLREVEQGTKYYAVCLTFIDVNNEDRCLTTYANAYDFSVDDSELMDFFGIAPIGNPNGMPVWDLYLRFNEQTPEVYTPLADRHREYVIRTIEQRTHEEGSCCYMAKHNGKKANGEQKNRRAINTAKTKLLRPRLFELLGSDPTISFCYRKEGEKTDAEIVLSLRKNVVN